MRIVRALPILLAACSGQISPAPSPSLPLGKADAPSGVPVNIVGSVALGTATAYANREEWNHSIDDDVIDAYTFQVPAYQQVSVGANFFDSQIDGPGGFVWIVDPDGHVLATNSPGNSDGSKRVPSWPFQLTLRQGGTYQIWARPLHMFEFDIDLIGRGVCRPASCGNNSCGTMSDGCGGQLDCGGCSGGATCGGTGTPNQCGVHQPTTGLPTGPVDLVGDTQFSCAFTDANEAVSSGTCSVSCALAGNAPDAVTISCGTGESSQRYVWGQLYTGPNYATTLSSTFQGNGARLERGDFDGTRFSVSVTTDGSGHTSLTIFDFTATGPEGFYDRVGSAALSLSAAR